MSENKNKKSSEGSFNKDSKTDDFVSSCSLEKRSSDCKIKAITAIWKDHEGFCESCEK